MCDPGVPCLQKIQSVWRRSSELLPRGRRLSVNGEPLGRLWGPQAWQSTGVSEDAGAQRVGWAGRACRGAVLRAGAGRAQHRQQAAQGCRRVPLAAQCRQPGAAGLPSAPERRGLHAEQRPLLHRRAGARLRRRPLPLLPRTPSSAAPARCPARPPGTGPRPPPRSASTGLRLGPQPGSCPSARSGGLSGAADTPILFRCRKGFRFLSGGRPARHWPDGPSWGPRALPASTPGLTIPARLCTQRPGSPWLAPAPGPPSPYAGAVGRA